MTGSMRPRTPWLDVIVLCHNRPLDAQRAIASVLAQNTADFRLTVSDNSSNDEVATMVRREFPTVHYVRRTPMLSAMQHFNHCIDDCTAGYFCLFHDDDLMAPNFVQVMQQTATAYPEAVALGCNAFIEVMGKLQASPSFFARHVVENIHSAKNLAARYFSRAQSGIAPFPGYVYQRSLAGSRRFLLSGGKYADVAWLLELARTHSVVWIRQPLMTYRMHEGNDGNTESRRDRLRFLGYLKRNRDWLGEGILQDYRCSFIYKILLKSQAPEERRKRLLVGQSFLSRYRWARYGRLDTYQSLLERARVKKAQLP